MKTDYTDPADDLFIEASEINDPAALEAFLNEKCAHDPSLLDRVRALLRASEGPSILKTPPAEVLHTLTSDKPGDTIGRYKLLERIGEGAFGTVFMAEQAEDVCRKVALKVIKPGMDSKHVIARFEAERQALAMMDHPNIARILDAGTTASGHPFFVMELVKGIPITQFCNERQLRINERLGLFMEVCSAIQHAHQKGIIHRDIKPSNVLVTLHGDQPVPKVIDFGIAKATQQRLTKKTLFTHFQQFIGTPAYMSPEQASLSSLDIDTRSDIYSLGVLLYELLTGKTPFDSKSLLEAGLDEMRRIIQEQEPANPSTRLSTLQGEERATVEKQHRVEPGKLSMLLRGDLDWIVMKALEKDRTRRYETASGFAADVQRHLQNETVVARPPSNLYRFQKLVRRNKFAVASVSAIAMALIVGLSVSTWMFFKERSAYNRAVAAEQEQTRLRKIADENRLTEVGLRHEAEIAKATEQKLREEADAARAIETRLRQDAEKAKANEQLLREAADAARETEVRLRRDAETAKANEQKLREKAEAEEQKAKSETAKSERFSKLLWRVNAGDDKYTDLDRGAEFDRDKTTLRDILDRNASERFSGQKSTSDEAQMRWNLGRAYQKLGVFDKAEAMLRESLEINRKLFGDCPNVADLLENLGDVYKNSGDWIKAEAMFREAMAMWRKLLGKNSDESWLLRQMGDVCVARNDFDKAERLFRESLMIRRKKFGNESMAVGESIEYLAAFLKDRGNLAAAEAMFREALAVRRKVQGKSVGVANSLNSLGEVLMERGLPEAEAMFREALIIQRTLIGNESLAATDSLYHLAEYLQDRGNLTEAEAMFREALAVRRKLLDKTDERVVFLLERLAKVLVLGYLKEVEPITRTTKNRTFPLLPPPRDRSGKLKDAESLYREALAIQRMRWGDNHSYIANLLTGLEVIFSERGDLTEEEGITREGLTIREKIAPDDWETFSKRLSLGHNLLQQKKYIDAEGFLSSGFAGVTLRKPIDLKSQQFLKTLLEAVVNDYGLLNQPAKAAEWRQKIEEFDKATAKPR